MESLTKILFLKDEFEKFCQNSPNLALQKIAYHFPQKAIDLLLDEKPTKKELKLFTEEMSSVSAVLAMETLRDTQNNLKYMDYVVEIFSLINNQSRLLKEREAIEREIRIGDEQIARGECEVLDDEFIDKFVARMAEAHKINPVKVRIFNKKKFKE